MAEQNIPSFAVDSDITPLQGRYFQYAKTGITDPRVRAQAYGLIKQTFGGIQQARDIQRARQQEEEDRALNMDVKRAQLEEGRLQLSMARDKFRRQQEAAGMGSAFYKQLDDVKNDTTLTPQQRASKLYETAANNADFLTDNEVAANRFNSTINSVKALETPKDINRTAEIDRVRRVVEGGVSNEGLAEVGLGQYAGSKFVEDIRSKKAEEEKTKQLEIQSKRRTVVNDTVKPYEDALETLKDVTKLRGEAAPSTANVDWQGIDDMLLGLDSLGLVDEQSKKELEAQGVRAFNPDAPLPKATTPQEIVDKNKKALRAIKNVILKAGTPAQSSAAPATKPAGDIDYNSLIGVN